MVGWKCIEERNIRRRKKKNIYWSGNSYKSFSHYIRWYTLSLPLEVTSGLDSFTAYTIVKVLKEMADNGKTIIAIVHQPSSDIFSIFDRTYILAAGREVYQVTFSF